MKNYNRSVRFALIGVLIVCTNFLIAGNINVYNGGQLRNAMLTAQAGDNILVHPGNYSTNRTTTGFPTGDGGTQNRSYYFRGVNNGTSSNKITLRSANPSDLATLEGGGIADAGYVLFITGNHWVVEDLRITDGGKGIILDNSDNTTIRRVEVFNIGQEGIHVRDGSDNALIDEVNLHDIGERNDGFGEGIYVGSDNSVWFEGNGSTTGENGRYYRRSINNTTIVNSIIGPKITAEPFDVKEGTENTIIENCIIYGTGVSGNNFADSHIDLKGNTTIVRCNTFYQDNNSQINRAIMVVPRVSAGVPSAFTANDNYIHDNTFYLDGSGVDVAVANNGAGDNYAWSNIRIPANGDFYNSRIIDAPPSGYSYSCGNGNGGGGQVCSAPGGRNTSNISQTAARLNWNSVASANSYDIRWRVSGGSWNNVNNRSGTNYNLSGLVQGTNYQWQIRSDCGSDESNYSTAVSFTTDSPAPASCEEPTGLNETNITSSSATLNWGVESGASGYNLRWRLRGGSWIYVNNLSGNSYQLTGLLSDREYQWRVRAICGGSTTSESPRQRFDTQPGSVSCNTPGGRSTSGVSQTSATLNWNNVNGSSNYDLRWRESGGSWNTVSNLNGTSYNLTSLSADTDYDWQVRTSCGGTNSSFSSISGFTTNVATGGGGGGNTGLCGGQNLTGSETVEICNVSPGQVFNAGDDVNIQVNFTSDVTQVRYYYVRPGNSWSWIGRARNAPYSMSWNNIPADATGIRARGSTPNGNTASIIVPITVVNSLNGAPTALSRRGDAQTQLYPNPVRQGQPFNLELTGVTAERVEIYDLRGAVVSVRKILPGTTRVTIETGDFPDGMYIVRIGDRVHKLCVRAL